MRLIETGTEAAFAAAAADWVGESLALRPHPTLALPTGRTPIPLYRELVTRARRGELDLHTARIFNLDEYRGLPASDPHSFAAFLHAHLIDPLRLTDARVRLLRGDAPSAEAECAAYDAAIAAAGGIDACILGLGENGHIAFNEPGSPFELTTHVASLSESTRAASRARAGDAWSPPGEGLTMGIGTLRAARRVLLLIAGENKGRAREALLRGVPDPGWPVSSLGAHADLTVIELCASA